MTRVVGGLSHFRYQPFRTSVHSQEIDLVSVWGKPRPVEVFETGQLDPDGGMGLVKRWFRAGS